jgi:Family of unknown function (DUF6402)
MLSDLRNIPRVMRGQGWNNGARLLDTWFSRPSAIAPAYSASDTTTIRMDAWALTFTRARRVYDQLIHDRIWANAPAQVEVANMLRRKGLLISTPMAFGRLSDPVPVQHADRINFRTVGSVTDFDDMTAALANFTFRVVVAGTVGPVAPAPGAPAGPTTYQVRITEVGVYIQDSFDFEGDQFLGCWSDSPDGFSPIPPPSGISIGPIPIPSFQYKPVFNSTFRDWRTSNGHGGDFLVFSDMKRVTLSTPDTFVI